MPYLVQGESMSPRGSQGGYDLALISIYPFGAHGVASGICPPGPLRTPVDASASSSASCQGL